MHIITIANKLDMSYDFYIRHSMHAVEGKINALNNKKKNLINKFNRNWKHPVNRKFESYRVWSFRQILKLTIKICSNLSNINIQYYLKFRIPMCHTQFFRIISQNREYVKTHCNDLNNGFHFPSRKWYLYNNPECWYSIITPIQIRIII